MVVKLPRKVSLLPVKSVYPDLNQPRRHFDLESLMGLANSIKANGLLKPIIVERITSERRESTPVLEEMLQEFDMRIDDDFFEATSQRRSLENDVYWVVVGHRRFEAHWRAGIGDIKARVIENLSPVERLILQLAEDSQEAIPLYEVAENIVKVHGALSKLHGRPEPLTLLGYRLGRTLNEVRNAFQYCDLEPNIRKAVRQGFSYLVATEIGRVKNWELQTKIFRQTQERSLSRRKTRELVDATIPNNATLRKEIREGLTPQTGEDQARTTAEYVQHALTEYWHVLMGSGETHLLSQKTIAWLRAETVQLSKAERQLYFQRTKRKFQFRVRKEVRELLRGTDLFGQPLPEFKDDRAYHARAHYYTLFNETYRSLTTFLEMTRHDPTLLKVAQSHDEVHRELEKFAEGLELLAPLIKERSMRKHGWRRYDLRGKNQLSTQEYKPAYTLEEKVRLIPLKRIKPDPDNVRRTFNQHSLEELAWNIKTNGQIEELLVKTVPDGYQIVTGERRYRAMQIVSIAKARCILVDNLSPYDQLILQIIEDSQKPFQPAERAEHWFRGYKLVNAQQVEQDKPLVSIPEFAKSIGKSPSTVRAAFSFLSLPGIVRQLVDAKVLTYSAAVEISWLPERYLGTQKDYSFDPTDDIYLTPERLFHGGQNGFVQLQTTLGLRAAYRHLNRQEIVALVAQNSPEAMEMERKKEWLFPWAYLEQLSVTNERKAIANDFASKLGNFRLSVKSLLDLPQIADGVYNYPLIAKKYHALSSKFGEFKKAFSNNRTSD